MSPGREPLPPRPTVPPPGPPPARSAPPRRHPALPTDPSALPPLPAVFHRTLAAGLGGLGLDLSQEQLEALDHFARLLLARNEAINLTAIREPEAVARDHLLDSLSATTLVGAPGVSRLVDLGTGGGLPGIPLAIALPALSVLLVESVGKKAAFLTTALEALGLGGRVRVAAERAEDLAAPGRERDAADVVTARAVAALPELIELAFPLLRVGGRLVAWKREPPPADLAGGRAPLEAELAAGRRAARALGGTVAVHPAALPALHRHRLVVVVKERPTARRYPRAPAERRAHPL